MSKSKLRKFLWLKRKLRVLINDNPIEFTYLVRDEKPVSVEFEDLGEYSAGVLVSAQDPRSGVLLSHYFNQRRIYLLKGVIVEPVQGILYDSKGKLIAESTTWPLIQLYNHFPWKPKKVTKVIDVDQTILLTSNSYGHWLLEDLGSFLFLAEKFPNAKILVSNNCPKYVKDLLLKMERAFIELSTQVKVSNLLHIGKSQDCGWMHPKDLESIRNFPLIKSALSQTSDPIKLYASRRNSKRSPKNEPMVESKFSALGYQIEALDELDFFDEIALLSTAAILASVHGSAHANAVFMQEKAKIIDLVNESYWTELGPRLFELQNQSYHSYQFQGALDSEINVDKLEDFLTKLDE